MKQIFTTKKRKYIASVIVFILIIVGIWVAIPEKVTFYVHQYTKDLKFFLDGTEIATQELGEAAAHCYGKNTSIALLTLMKGVHHIKVDHPILNDSGIMDFQLWIKSYVSVRYINGSWDLYIYYDSYGCM